MRVLAVIALGGVLGSLLRYAVFLILSPVDPSVLPSGTYFPWGTLAVNLVGACAIGVAIPLLRGRADLLQAFWVTGVLGGFTTFSAFAADAVLVSEDQSPVIAGIYIAATLAGGVLAVAFGSALASRRQP